MTTEFDTRLNQWFDSVEPKHLPASILPQVFDEVDHTGQRRMPWHRFAASIELGWTRHSALPPALVMVILTALLLIALAAAAIAGGYVRLPERPRVMDGLIAVANELKNPDAAVPGNNVIRFIDPETGDDVYATSDSGSNCGAHFSPDGSRYVLLYQNPDQIGTGVVNIGVARSEAGSQPTFLFRKEAQAFFDPSWSPDGSAIVTTIEDATGTGLGGSLWVLRADGSVARQINGRSDVDLSQLVGERRMDRFPWPRPVEPDLVQFDVRSPSRRYRTPEGPRQRRRRAVLVADRGRVGIRRRRREAPCDQRGRSPGRKHRLWAGRSL